VFVLCGAAVVAALALHRWPRTRPAHIDLAEVQQRVEALRQEVEKARAAPDPADAYIPEATGSVADLATAAAALLRQLPGVLDVEALVTCPKPTPRIIYLRDLHWVAKADFGVEVGATLGRPVAGEELDLPHEELFLQSELVQAEHLALLRCLANHHGLRRLLGECLTVQGVAGFHKHLAEVQATDAGLTRLKGQRLAVGGRSPEIDQGIAEPVQGRRAMLSEYGAAGRDAGNASPRCCWRTSASWTRRTRLGPQ
jgi:hypothetical protein